MLQKVDNTATRVNLLTQRGGEVAHVDLYKDTYKQKFPTSKVFNLMEVFYLKNLANSSAQEVVNFHGTVLSDMISKAIEGSFKKYLT